VPQWLEHPNQVAGIAAVNIVAVDVHHALIQEKFDGLYANATLIDGGFEYQSANGVIRVFDATSFQQHIGPLAQSIIDEGQPCIAGMDLVMTEPSTMQHFLKTSGLDYREVDNGFVLTTPELTANTTLRFVVR